MALPRLLTVTNRLYLEYCTVVVAIQYINYIFQLRLSFSYSPLETAKHHLGRLSSPHPVKFELVLQAVHSQAQLVYFITVTKWRPRLLICSVLKVLGGET